MGNCPYGSPRARLVAAVHDGDVSAARRVLRSNPGLDVCSPDPETQLAPLLMAKWVEHPSKVVVLAKLLIEAGADVDAVSPRGETALFSTRNLELVQLLLASGADTSVRDSKGCTALHSLAAWGATRCVGALLDAGAEVDAVDDLGQTPLHKAAMGHHVGALALLIAAGAHPDTPDAYDTVPIILARQAETGTPLGLQQIERILAGVPIEDAMAQSYATGDVVHYRDVSEFVDGALEQLPRGHCWACGPQSVCPGFEHGGAYGVVLEGDLFFPCEQCSDGLEGILVRVQLATGLVSSEFVVLSDRRFVAAAYDREGGNLVVEGEKQKTLIPVADLPGFVPFRDGTGAAPGHVALTIDRSPAGGGRGRSPGGGSESDEDDDAAGGMSVFMATMGTSTSRTARSPHEPEGEDNV